jgi:SAM-dependent methyltransferase
MKPEQNYIEINTRAWNNKVETHVASEFYNMPEFLNGKSSLNPIELELLGDLNGKSVLHLQCHFGQDSISLSRLGARVIGVDLSDKAIDYANKIAAQTHANASFICCNVYDLDKHLNEQFDYVFISYGTIGWLPDLSRWAKVVSSFLKPGGQLIFVEFHPVIWMFNDEFSDVIYSYFNVAPIVETENGTYANKEANITQTSVSWNHDLSEVFTALLQQGLHLKIFKEYDYSPYRIFSNMEETEPGKFNLTKFARKLPMVYAIVAEKSEE